MSVSLVDIIQISLTVWVGFAAYCILLRHTAWHLVNRVYLLSLPLLALLMHLVVDWVGAPIGVFTIPLPEVSTDLVGATAAYERSTVNWIMGIWLLGSVFRLLVSGWTLLQIRERISLQEGPSFTFLRHIHIASGLSAEVSRAVRLHEETHARQLHSLDLLWMELWQIVFWFDPVYGLIRRNLRQVHEYIADEAANKEVEDYREMIVAQTFGLSSLPLTNEFSTSTNLKSRIMMIDRTVHKTAKYRLAGAFFILLGFGLCIACADPKAIETEGPIYEVVDQMPVFSGCDSGAMESEQLVKCSQEKLFGYVGARLKYPKEEEKSGKEGLVVIEFVVSDQGDVEQAKVLREAGKAFDTAALEMVKSMPRWTPGVHNGKQVNVKMTLPVKFALADEGK